jgi:phosphohistidine phosphatase
VDLILWRHADAEDGSPDAARRLTAKGHKQAARMAAWLSARLPKHYTLLASPAQRAQQTASALAREFLTGDEVGLSATPASLLKAAGWPDAPRAVVIVGHQPCLGMTVARLLTGREAEWSVRKGAIYWFEQKHGRASLRAAVVPELA